MPGDAPGRRRLKFSGAQRLKHTWEFERTRTEGQRLVKGCLILNWRIGEEQSVPRLGVITSKKVGNAVARSCARRLLREAFRLHQHDLDPRADLVLIARASISRLDSIGVAKDFVSAAKQARIWETR